MKLLYLARKIRDPRGLWFHKQNIHAAEQVAIRLWQMGFAVICPGLNTYLFDGTLPTQAWLDGDFEMIRRCDALVLAPGWETSEGANAERGLALSLGLPVFVWLQHEAELAIWSLEDVDRQRWFPATRSIGVFGGPGA